MDTLPSIQTRKGRKGTIRIINSFRDQLNWIENRWRESSSCKQLSITPN